MLDNILSMEHQCNETDRRIYKKLTDLVLLGPPLIPHGLTGIEQEAGN